MGAEKVSHRLLAVFGMRKLQSALESDTRAQEVRSLDTKSLKTGATLHLGSYRQALHAFIDFEEAKLVVGCLLPLQGADATDAKALRRRIRQLPQRALPDGSNIRMSVGPKSLDTWVTSTIEYWSSDTAAETALGEIITAAGEALAALGTIRKVRRARPPLYSEKQLSLPLFNEDDEPQLNFPILTTLE